MQALFLRGGLFIAVYKIPGGNPMGTVILTAARGEFMPAVCAPESGTLLTQRRQGPVFIFPIHSHPISLNCKTEIGRAHV